ncbi:MAG: FtsX-like permease family protein [Alphaproteobacteria bacterium]|nr:hypothetical protein [Alphaproteobacteria bacterium]NCB49686.1 FtsX-like permease family protein [Alphaproteobacteria bacterium]
MYRNKSSLPFVYDSSSLFLPWMIMLMIFIASLSAAGGISLNNTLQHWNRAISGSLTIQIPTHDKSGTFRGENVNQDIEKTLSYLRGQEAIKSAKKLSTEQMRKLMDPWLGNLEDFNELPLPELIDVTLNKEVHLDFDSLKEGLLKIVPSASLDLHRVWLERLIALAEGVKKITTLVLILLILTTSLTVIYSTRSSLAVHKPAIELLHMMGAKDSYIAFQYALRVLKLSLLGGFAGLGLSFPVILTISALVTELKGSFLMSAPQGSHFWSLLAFLPFLASALSVGTAYLTVHKHLRRFI